MRRRRPVEAAPSHERWLVSYSDFITLLFSFFVVLFASAYRDNHSIVRVSHSIQNGFQTMGAFSSNRSNVTVSSQGLPLSVSPVPAPDPKSAPASAPDAAGSLSPANLLQLKQQLQSAIGPELKDHEVDLRLTPEGFVISLRELGFFNSGQAVLLPGAAEKISRIAAILAERRLNLRIEGHSDNQPIHNAQFRSNWELSTARAMNVLLLLVNNCHYDPQRVSVAGYGQYRPMADNATPDGRRMNRRVDLVILDSSPGSRVH